MREKQSIEKGERQAWTSGRREMEEERGCEVTRRKDGQ